MPYSEKSFAEAYAVIEQNLEEANTERDNGDMARANFYMLRAINAGILALLMYMDNQQKVDNTVPPG